MMLHAKAGSRNQPESQESNPAESNSHMLADFAGLVKIWICAAARAARESQPR
jgi:hypothetical protein